MTQPVPPGAPAMTQPVAPMTLGLPMRRSMSTLLAVPEGPTTASVLAEPATSPAGKCALASARGAGGCLADQRRNPSTTVDCDQGSREPSPPYHLRV